MIYAGPIQVRGSSLVGGGDGGRGLFVTRSVAAGELLFIAQPNAHAPVSDVLELYLHQPQRGECCGDQQPTSGGAAAIRTVSEVSEECSCERLWRNSRKEILRCVRRFSFCINSNNNNNCSRRRRPVSHQQPAAIQPPAPTVHHHPMLSMMMQR
jgi:hypothetical protein